MALGQSCDSVEKEWAWSSKPNSSERKPYVELATFAGKK